MSNTDEPLQSVDQIVAQACARTRLSDFGAEGWREGLEILFQSNEAADAPRERKQKVYARYVDLLSNRLRLIEYTKAHPEVLKERIDRPLIVIGMPRSGTTITSILLDQDPSRRSLLLWEALDSVPPPTTETLRTDPRCIAMLKRQQAWIATHPEIVRPHVELADRPTECIQIHGQDFKALVHEAPMPVRDYSRWIMSADITSAYEYERLVLQVLQSSAPGTWSLKMPSHALHIEWLVKVFPDARIVWTHRDPYRALASLFSMKSKRWQRNTGDPGIEWLREHYVWQLSEHANRPMRLRRRIGDAQFYDLYYSDLVRDPVDALRRMYRWAGDEFTDEVESRMRMWLDRNPRDQFGKHRYTLGQFGLTTADLEPHFEEYLATYDVEMEGV